LKLLPEEKQQIEQKGTSNLEAYDLYLRALSPAFTPDAMRARIALLEAATQLAPEYSDAWGALAHARAEWRYCCPYAERDEIGITAAAAAERALGLDPHNSLALWAQFGLLPSFGRFAEADVLTTLPEQNGPRDGAIRYPHLESLCRL